MNVKAGTNTPDVRILDHSQSVAPEVSKGIIVVIATICGHILQDLNSSMFSLSLAFLRLSSFLSVMDTLGFCFSFQIKHGVPDCQLRFQYVHFGGGSCFRFDISY